MNTCIFDGRLTGDPVVNERGAFFTLAVDRDYKNEDGGRPVDYLPISSYGGRADRVEQYLHKGDRILVTATAQSYKDKETNHNKYTFKMEKMDFVDVRFFKDNKDKGLQEAPEAEIPEELTEDNNQ